MFLSRLLARRTSTHRSPLPPASPARWHGALTLENIRLAKNAISDRCTVLTSLALAGPVREILPGHTMIAADTPHMVVNSLVGRQQKTEELLLTPTSFFQAWLTDSSELRRLTRSCAGKLWLENHQSLSEEGLARTVLHRSGFYEVASWTPATSGRNYDRSSIGLYPDGQFQMCASMPGNVHNATDGWLVASRLPIRDTQALPWHWIYGVGEINAEGALTTQTDTDPVLTIRPRSSSTDCPQTIRISASFSWPKQLKAAACGSLVGCYHGPGDSHMYLAMIEPQLDGQVRVSLWRNLVHWEQLATLLLSASRFSENTIVSRTVPRRQSEFTFEITPIQLRLYCGTQCALTVVDDSLARNEYYGARLLGTQLQLSHIDAVTLP